MGSAAQSFTLVTPANHYPSRLPDLRGGVRQARHPALRALALRPVPADAPPRRGDRGAGRRRASRLPLRAEGRLAARRAASSTRWDRRVRLPAAGLVRAERRRAAGALMWSSAATSLAGPGGARAVRGHRDDEPFDGHRVPGFRRRELLARRRPGLDFNMSLLQFDPGVGLDKVEIHDEEHGLYMTAGEGIYLLDDERHEVTAATSSTWLRTARSPSSPRARGRPSTCSTRTSGATASESARGSAGRRAPTSAAAARGRCARG